MDSKEIERLLAKYWACETSLEEEQALREYFLKAEPTDATRDAAALFAYFEMQRASEVRDVALDQRIAGIATPKPRTFGRFVQASLRIAAGIAVLAAAVWLVRSEIREKTPQEMVDTYSDPELAFEETKRALLIISKSFSTAEEQARKLDLFNEAQRKVRSEMEEQTKEVNSEL
ncbi:MAG: hypothetical protein LOY03_16390 [Cyclobacteriaceae bacterium]|nr:hypothetical protein [Cyclobacteriaceae bacterium]